MKGPLNKEVHAQFLRSSIPFLHHPSPRRFVRLFYIFSCLDVSGLEVLLSAFLVIRSDRFFFVFNDEFEVYTRDI